METTRCFLVLLFVFAVTGFAASQSQCKNEGEVCEDGSSQCCRNECRKSNNSTTFTCTQVTGVNRGCGVNGTGAPCARSLTCLEREVIPLAGGRYLDLGSVQLNSDENARAFICVAPRTCVEQGGECNNFLDGRRRCCTNNDTAATKAFCRNTRGDGIAQVIGTCVTCGNSCSRNSDCCVSDGFYCELNSYSNFYKRCRQCARKGVDCSNDRKCCDSQDSCQKNRFTGLSQPLRICD